MDLLPQSHTEFSSTEYWEKFFKKRGNKAFEWYGEYTELCGILHKYIKTADKLLVIGCGNSQLSANMYDVGYHNIVNIDISEIVIRQMTEKNHEQRPHMMFLRMDMLKMDFADGQHSVVLDKGTLDALMTDSSQEVSDRVDQMFAEISRVLRIGGRYLCISLAQDHILKKVLDYFPREGWMTRVHRVVKENEENSEFYMPVFVFVFTKFKKMPNMTPVLEVAYFDDKVDRCDSIDKVISAVKELQQYGIIKHQLNTKSHVEEDLYINMFSAASSTPRYTLHIVDSPNKMRHKFAVFIVPQGRETEWLFSTDEGRKQVSASAGYQRLIVASLQREHTYESLDSVKAELSSKVMELAPPGLGNVQVPFLSIGDDVGSRTVRYQGNSEFSGDFVVEDVQSEDTTYRKLIFLNNKQITQSEARLVVTKKKGGKKKSKLTVDANYLGCTHHGVMVAGLAFLEDFAVTMDLGVSIVVIGLGGGGLPNFLHKNYRKVTVEAIEIDSAMATVATDWFECPQDDRIQIHIADGLQFIKDVAAKGEKKHVIMLDADNKDTTMGMSCPPQAFVDPSFLKCIDSVLHPNGVFILNLVCRSKSCRDTVLKDLQSVFSTIYSKKLKEEVNEIIFALPSSRTNSFEIKDNGKLPKELSSSLRILHDIVKVESKRSDIPNLVQSLNDLKILPT